MDIAIIDYKMSNMFSIRNALDFLGYKSHITSDPKIILAADGAVLPGVGSFPEAMRHLNDLHMIGVIKEFIASGKPFMGICLGLQLLFSKSEELHQCEGLGIIDGTVEGLSQYITSKPIPHVGWNTIINQHSVKQKKIGHSSKIRLSDNEYYYFVHSYFVKPDNEEHVFTLTRYGDHEFCSSIVLDNIFACQFHPEKSGQRGLKILEYFFSLEI
jgi:glutamine amidotransferase|tara:strand:+ start:1133 stop:1774 length:642 start_codon:yes stop_codon:yes gene_type:complete